MQSNMKTFIHNLKHINIKSPRLKVLKVIHFLLVAILLTRVFFINYVYSPVYVAFSESNASKVVVKKSQTRGAIFDRHGRPLVTNTPISSIIYRYNQHATTEELRQTANHLAQLITVDTTRLTRQSRIDLYASLYPAVASKDIDDSHLATLTENELGGLVIFNKMIEAYYGGENTLKADISDDEVARVLESITPMPGVDVVVQGARKYPEDLGHYDIVGRVSKGDSSRLTDDFRHYFNIGYTINDPIGYSSIEQMYEPLLKGHKQIDNVYTTGERHHVTSGISGADLTLTIDTVFSDLIDDILEKHMSSALKTRPGAKYLREGYVVAVNPNTGEILSLNGKIKTDDNQFIDHSLGTMHNAFTVGSVVKGATLLTGYLEDVTQYGAIINDSPMIFSDGSKKASWTNLGPIDDIAAIRSSSNVYFMQQAIRLGGDIYVPKKNLNLSNDTLTIHRNHFANFGLGSHTGIDLPCEQTGLINQDNSIAKLLDYVIGQSDTYTTLQLAQYISTIANGGNRYALHLLKEAATPHTDSGRQILYTHEPILLNTIDLPPIAFTRVQEGFRQVLQSPKGTGYEQFKYSKHSPAGKTGTAEEFARDASGKLMYDSRGQLIPTNHMTFVGYAPHQNPQIAIAVVFPQAEIATMRNPIALEVANEIIDTYFKGQKR